MLINISSIHTDKIWKRVLLCLGTSATVQPPVPVSAHVDCEVGKSQVGDAVSSNSNCWSHKHYDYFREVYPWMIVKVDKCGEGRLGCSVCCQLSKLGCEQQQRMHLSSEWRDCNVSIKNGSTKAKQQTSARKKLFLHDQLLHKYRTNANPTYMKQLEAML